MEIIDYYKFHKMRMITYFLSNTIKVIMVVLLMYLFEDIGNGVLASVSFLILNVIIGYIMTENQMTKVYDIYSYDIEAVCQSYITFNVYRLERAEYVRHKHFPHSISPVANIFGSKYHFMNTFVKYNTVDYTFRDLGFEEKFDSMLSDDFVNKVNHIIENNLKHDFKDLMKFENKNATNKIIHE